MHGQQNVKLGVRKYRVSKQVCSVCMYSSNTTLFDAESISSIYYIRYNYMFRRLTMAIFRLYMKYLVVIRDLIRNVYRGEVGGEVDTRSRMCHGGLEVWVHGVSAIVCMSELIMVRSKVSYYVCCRNYMYIYILILYIYNVQYCTRIWILWLWLSVQ